MLICTLVFVLISIVMGIYGYFNIMTQIRFIKNGNEDNFCSFEKARLDAMADNGLLHKQFDSLHQHIAGIVPPLASKLDILANLITNIPNQLEIVSALIRRLPDKDFFHGRFDVLTKQLKEILDIANFIQPLVVRNKSIDENLKSVGQQLNAIDQFVAKIRPIDDMMKALGQHIATHDENHEKVLAQILGEASDTETVVRDLAVKLRGMEEACKKLSQKPDAFNDLALIVNQIKKELANLAVAISSSEDRLQGQIKRELAKPVPLALPEQTERRLIDTFIKINKILLKQEDPEKLSQVKKAKPEVKKPGKEKTSKITPEIVQKIKALRSKGMSYLKIGKKLSLSQATVYKVINS